METAHIISALLSLVLVAQAVAFTPVSPALFTSDVSSSNSLVSTKTLLAASTSPVSNELELPPKDETYTFVGQIREILSAPTPPEGTPPRYENIGGQSGGIWRTKHLGILPTTVLAAPVATPWIKKQEAAGNMYIGWPQSVRDLLGSKGVSNLGGNLPQHAFAKRAFNEALSPKATLAVRPFVEDCLDRRVQWWKKKAEHGEEVAFLDELADFTVEVIVNSFLGAAGRKPSVMEEIRYLIVDIASGMFSVPRRVWWPLSKLSTWRYGPAMKARKRLDEVLGNIVNERRGLIEACPPGKTVPGGGVLDSLLKLQALQKAKGGPAEGELLLDDKFLFDSITTALFAGYDTTSATMARILHLVKTEQGREALEPLRAELESTEIAASTSVGGASSMATDRAATGLFRGFPILEAVVSEANRLYPAVGGTYRRIKHDSEYNGYFIPGGSSILWNLAYGGRSEKLYPGANSFCPFRFLHRRNDGQTNGGAEASDAASSGAAHQLEPPLEMFGFGRHMCPGRELAKLEIILFMKRFLHEFDYRLVEKQSFKGRMPTNAPKDKLKLVLISK